MVATVKNEFPELCVCQTVAKYIHTDFKASGNAVNDIIKHLREFTLIIIAKLITTTTSNILSFH